MQRNVPCRSLLETTMNTRDLGGYETGIPGVFTRCNRVYRSDTQDDPSDADFAFLQDMVLLKCILRQWALT